MKLPRTLVLLGAALVALPAAAQVPRTGTADQGKPNGGAPWFVLLYLNGAPVGGSNPFPVTVNNAFALDATITARLGTLGQKNAAGSAPVVPASDYVPQLPTNAATSALQAETHSAPGVAPAKVDNVQGVIGGVPLPTADSVGFQEGTAVSVAANGTLVGTNRLTGVAQGTVSPYGRFRCNVYSTQAGTLYVFDTSVSIAVISQGVVAASQPLELSVPAFGTSYICQFTDGATAATVSLRDGFTAY